MTEREKPDSLVNDFPRIETKVKNHALGHAAAWEAIQPLLAGEVENYPGQYRPFLGVIHQIFNLRREVYLGGRDKEMARRELIKLQEGINEKADPAIVAVNHLLKEIFTRPIPSKNASKKGKEG